MVHFFALPVLACGEPVEPSNVEGLLLIFLYPIRPIRPMVHFFALPVLACGEPVEPSSVEGLL
jgi:hypothetical protein